MSSFIALLARCLLVLLFFPFSALDKVLNFKEAVHQASEASASATLARTLIVAGFLIEVIMSIAILTGVAESIGCVYPRRGIALLPRSSGSGSGRCRTFGCAEEPRPGGTLGFTENVALAGGFMMLAFGTDASGVRRFFHHPLASSRPYAAFDAGEASP